MSHRSFLFFAVGLLLAATTAHGQVESSATAPFYNFESGQVRPLVLSADGQTLCVLNTADGRVEVFDALALTNLGSVFTGLEPIAMAFNPAAPNELWVVNHVSDSIAIVDLASLMVKTTLAVGDEPQDVTFAAGKAFVSCTRAPSIANPGAWDENVVVIFDATTHTRLTNVVLAALRPRSLLADGGNVYVLTEHSGNHTTILSEADATALGLTQLTLDGYDQNFALNNVLKNPVFSNFAFGWAIPPTGRIVFDFEYSAYVHQLEDRDVSVIDAASGGLLGNVTTGAGTTLFAMAKSPFANELWIAGTDAQNRFRFERQVAGKAVRNQVAIATPGGAVQQTLNLAPPFTPVSHSQPVQIAFSSTASGKRAYIASFGTANITIVNAVTKGFQVDLAVTGEGPIGLAADSMRGRLYVYCRISNEVRVFDIEQGYALVGGPKRLSYDPEPRAVKQGRGLLYDARSATGAGNGNMACSTCHVFGHTDQLAWDLGNSEGALSYFFPDLLTGPVSFGGQIVADTNTPIANPMKGPMTTQSLRGLRGNTPLHWRGDRRALQSFQPAFHGLLGGSGVTDVAMQSFSTFVNSIVYPPNPFEPKDRVYTGDEKNGSDKFGATPGKSGKVYRPFSGLTCDTCHLVDLDNKTDFTGSQETVNFDGEVQLFNTAQLRGAYEKQFAQLGGFGILHDGSVDSIRDFLDLRIIGGDAFPSFTPSDRDQVAAFVKAWDTGLSPLVGQQFTLNSATLANADAFLDLAEAQAQPPASNIDLIFKGFVLAPHDNVTSSSRPIPWKAFPLGIKERHGGVLALNPATSTYQYRIDSVLLGYADRATLKSLVAAGLVEVTFTCVPPGTGTRLGIDRDEDGLLDADETLVGTSPDNPDTDGDGYADGAEFSIGGNPLRYDAHLPDQVPPTILQASIEEVFVSTATAVFTTNEPASALVEVGTQSGVYTMSFADGALVGKHAIVLSGLPANTTLFARITTKDKNANSTQSSEMTFVTRPTHLHIQSMTLTKNGTGPFTLTVTVSVRDRSGLPVANVPIQAFWDGDIGGNPQRHEMRTDASGTATYTTQPFTPAGSTKVTFSPLFLGSIDPSDPFFVGRGGQGASFFYEEPANEVNYRAVDVP
jgi:hypothetical protein